MNRQIVALDQDLGIAKNGDLPWKLPTDEAYFQSQTRRHGGVLLMGRGTYDAMGKALPGRRNFVLTHASTHLPDAEVVHDLGQFMNSLTTDLWIIGGGDIFRQTLDQSDELYITQIAAKFDCDTFYPEYEDRFEPKSIGKWQTENGLKYRFCVYIPKKR